MSRRSDEARLIRFSALSACLVGLLAGCVEPRPPDPAELARGLVLLLPGIEGSRAQLTGMVAGLRDAGVDWGLEVIPWDGWSSLDNLTNLPANQERARRIAGRIAEYRRSHEGRAVMLVGYSGGGGLAVLAAEALPQDVTLDRLILIGAALAPTHDMTSALAHCRGDIVNFYSEEDWFFLSLGTNLFGTIDRANTPAAGRIGLRDAEGKLLAGGRITQISWLPEWRKYGHDGGHIGWLSREWSCVVLADWIKQAAPEHPG